MLIKVTALQTQNRTASNVVHQYALVGKTSILLFAACVTTRFVTRFFHYVIKQDKNNASQARHCYFSFFNQLCAKLEVNISFQVQRSSAMAMKGTKTKRPQ